MLILDSIRSSMVYAMYFVFFAALFLVCHRILLHRLYRYPGPIIAKITDWYAGFYVIQQRLPQKILRLHQKYGSVVRIGPNRLVFDTVTAFQDIYQSDQITKSYTYLSTTKNNVVNVFTALDNDVHRSKRRVIGQAVTDRALREFEPAMMEQIEIYLDQIRDSSRASSPVNMTEKSRHLSLDIVGQLAFGYNLSAQTLEDNRYIIRAMYFGNYRGNIYHHLFFLSRLYITRIFDYVFYQAREKYWRLVETMIQKRMAEDKHAKPDLYSFVADTMSADPDSLRGGTLWAEAIFFLVAGGDTVATGISAVFFYLTRNPECYQKLAREIRSAFPSSQDIKAGTSLSGCTYLRACIDEALRMSSPISTTLWREKSPTSSKPLVVDGHFIPDDTLIGVNAYALHHNEQYFPQPFTFRPERWLNNEGNEEARKVARAAFAVFSNGPRACAGKSMAYLEISLVIAKTLWSFDFERAPGYLGDVGGGKPGAADGRLRPGEFQIRDIFTARHDGPYVVFRPRNG